MKLVVELSKENKGTEVNIKLPELRKTAGTRTFSPGIVLPI